MSICIIGIHLLPEGGTEHTSTAPAILGCILPISTNQSVKIRANIEVTNLISETNKLANPNEK